MNTLYDVVPSSVRHIKPLAAVLRPAACEALRAFGSDPRRSLHSALRGSTYSRTAIMNGQPIAMWGAHGPMLSDKSTIWAAFGQAAVKFPLAIVRRARIELAAMAGSGNRLYASVAKEDNKALLFAETLGFRCTDEFGGLPGMQPMVFRQPAAAPVLDGDRPPFVIHGLGRSRTAWLSAFLSYGKWTCLHEQAVNLKTAADVPLFLNRPRTGYAETAAHFAWPIIVRLRPDVRQVVIARPVEDAIVAMCERYTRDRLAFDYDAMRKIFLRADRVLAKISALPNTLILPFDALETEEGCRAVFEFCLPYKWDHAWWEKMREEFVESDLASFVERFQGERPRFDVLKRDLKREMFKIVRADAVR